MVFSCKFLFCLLRKWVFYSRIFSLKKITPIKIGYFRTFSPHWNWTFSWQLFSRVDGMLFKHSFNLFLCFYIEKLYVIMRKDTQWIWITESASLRNRHEMCNEWNRQTSESTRMYYILVLCNVPIYLKLLKIHKGVPLWILSTIYYVCIRWNRIKFHVPNHLHNR